MRRLLFGLSAFALTTQSIAAVDPAARGLASAAKVQAGVTASLLTARVSPSLASTRPLRLAIDAVRDGAAPSGPIVIESDSTGRGNHASGSLSKADAWPTRLAAELTARGLAASSDNFFGASNLTSLAQVSTEDPRLSFGTGWLLQSQFTAGGYFFKFPANTAVTAVGFTPVNAFNQADIWLLVSSATTASVTILRGSTAATSTVVSDGPVGGGSLKLRRIRASWSGNAATGTLNVQAADGAQPQFFLFGAQTRDTASPRLEIINLSCAGSNSQDWVSTALGIYGPQALVSFLAPVAQLYGHGVNDFNSGTTTGGSTGPTALASYQANIASYIGLLPGTTTLLIGTIPSNPANYASVATQQSYLATLQAAAANGNPVIDPQSVAGGFAQASADGLMADDRHGTAAYYERIGRQIAQWMLTL